METAVRRMRRSHGWIRLFPDSGPDIALDPVDSRADSEDVTIQVYRPIGRPQYAS